MAHGVDFATIRRRPGTPACPIHGRGDRRSRRNVSTDIRAHQSRKLLHPPIRKGRACYYDETHVQRLRYIISLQRQGSNLVSIAALIGVGNRVTLRGLGAASASVLLREELGRVPEQAFVSGLMQVTGGNPSSSPR
ncbi:MerR family transcriptional regulator [Streptomyces sp. NPDC087849]|uniref:MerR family transcriptional regulator n=1 Tax=Streptomyces sp. NPDC087849 TaxID=3365808 RepID=UPI0037FB109E